MVGSVGGEQLATRVGQVSFPFFYNISESKNLLVLVIF